MKVASLFAGIGGFDLGFERAGFEIAWQVEINKTCLEILSRHWPNVPKYQDIKKYLDYGFKPVDIVCGGDPCQIRSRAKGNRPATCPDMAGWFLAVVGKLWPRWVVRENVPAPDVKEFEAALAILGYRSVIIRANSCHVTGQHRVRDFVVGSLEEAWPSFACQLLQQKSSIRHHSQSLETKPFVPALTAHRQRYDTRDCYIWEGKRLRVLDSEERQALTGFPENWLDGLSESVCAKLCGNAVVPQICEWIGNIIMRFEQTIKK